MTIFTQPCVTKGPRAWNHAHLAIQRLHGASIERKHTLIEDSEKADLVLITNIPPDDHQVALRHHPIVQRHIAKAFQVSEAWDQPCLLSGMHVNATKGFNFRRFRTGSYALHHPDFKNPLCEGHNPEIVNSIKPDLLASFMGRDCHSSRKALFNVRFKRKDILIKDTSDYNAFTHQQEGKEINQIKYYNTFQRSKFVLCPRGVGASSIRLFESLRLGIAPVIISDAWLPCIGPDWSSGAIIIKERNIPEIERILEKNEPRYAELGAAARRIHDQYFSDKVYFNFLIENLFAIQRERPLPERFFSFTWPAQTFVRRSKQRLQRVAKRLSR